MTPPCVRRTRPFASSLARSRRTLAADAPSSAINSSREMLPLCRNSLRMWSARFPAFIGFESLRGKIASHSRDLIIFSAFDFQEGPEFTTSGAWLGQKVCKIVHTEQHHDRI